MAHLEFINHSTINKESLDKTHYQHFTAKHDLWAAFLESRAYFSTYREQELFDLLHGMSHAHVRIRNRSKHLDEHMKLHGQVCVLWLSTFSQAILLKNKNKFSRSNLPLVVYLNLHSHTARQPKYDESNSLKPSPFFFLSLKLP